MASSRSMFGNAIAQILNSWSALQLAVEHHFGGADSREKAEWMVLAIETWFRENDGIESYEVEEFLEDVLNSEFDLKVEDNSIPEISQLICLMSRLCQENKVEEVQHRLQALPKPSLQNCRRGDDDIDDDLDCNIDEETTASSSSSSVLSQHNTASTSSQSANPSGNMEDMDISDEKVTDEDGWRVICRGKRK